MREVIVVGNGLGMALSPDDYSLTNALTASWADKEADRQSEAAYIALLAA
ncbi:hypothetical protein PAF17_20045 [Paracoccus sp. Z330]|uniref:Uncharacterized protein n=1 Tax=Paracoccus onchidii TaxID=3017813 RepID=A0ABT4ZK35_9RHOB|nr:hypothetical protein [Paracoccus onchidii]MDB6179729.1 hypothetical protein [Paracoccus onchidii]